MLELFYACVKCTLNTKNPLLPPQKSVKVDLIQENTGSFTTKKLLFSYEKYENAYAKRGVTVNPTIYDVSRLSGVSIATVSRAFSNPERVREDTRRKVFEAAEVLHYSPNAIARAMARQRTDKIAFLICKEGATILDEFYAGICTGIMRETNRSDFELVISTAADWDTASNTSKNKQVEGVILGGNARPDMIAELQNRDLAVVLVNNRIQGLDIPCVVSDEYGGVRQALEHLIGRGHRNIAMLAGRFSPYILGPRPAGRHPAHQAVRSHGGECRRGLPGAAVPAGPAHGHLRRKRRDGRRSHEGRPPPGPAGAGGPGGDGTGRQLRLRDAGAGAHLRPHRLPPDGGVERGAAPGAAGRGDGRPPGHGGAHRAAGARLQLTRTLEKYRMPRVRGGNSAMRKNEEERI